MKVGVLSSFLLLLSFQAVSQVDPQISVRELKELSKEAKNMIKDFEVDSSEGKAVGAPDYKFAQAKLRERLERKSEALDHFLKTFNNAVSSDYNIIKDVKSLGKSQAVKETVQVAKDRFISRAKSFEGNYQKELMEFMFGGLEGIEKECITVLCVNQVKADIEKWLDKSKSINKKLKLDGVSLNKLANSRVKAHREKSLGKIADSTTGKPLVLETDSKEYKNLTDSMISKKDLEDFTPKEISELGVKSLRNQRYSCFETYPIDVPEVKNKTTEVEKEFILKSPIVKLKDGTIGVASYNVKKKKLEGLLFKQDGTLIKSIAGEPMGTLPDGRIIIRVEKNALGLFDPRTDKVEPFLSAPSGEFNMHPTVLQDGTAVIVSTHRGHKSWSTVHFVNPDGTKKSEHKLDHQADNLQVLQNGQLLLNNYETISVMDASGKVVSRQNEAYATDLLELPDGNLLLSSRNRLIIQKPNGDKIKEVATDDSIRSSVSLKDGTIVISNWGNEAIFLKPDGALKAKYNVGEKIARLKSLKDGAVLVKTVSEKSFILNSDGTKRVGMDISSYANSVIEAQDGSLISINSKGLNLTSFTPSGKKMQVVAGVNCSEAQINDTSLPRTNPRGASRQ